jgi:AraC-like DNA-binding protein
VEWFVKKTNYRIDGCGGTSIKSNILDMESVCHSETCILAGLADEFSVSRPVYLTEYDLESLHSIEQMIRRNITRHYPIADLSRDFGINEFKLKQGFRQVFGNSIYDYQLKIRMEKARDLLGTGRRQIKEIARFVGYKSASSFIAAFKKEYKLSPAAWKRASE